MKIPDAVFCGEGCMGHMDGERGRLEGQKDRTLVLCRRGRGGKEKLYTDCGMKRTDYGLK